MAAPARQPPAARAARGGGRTFALDSRSLDSPQQQVGTYAGIGWSDLLKGPYDKVDLTAAQVAALWGGAAPSSADAYVTAPAEKSVGYVTAAYNGPAVQVIVTQDAADPSTQPLRILGATNVPWGTQVKIQSLPLDPAGGAVRAWTVYDVPVQMELKANAAAPGAAGSPATTAPVAPGAAGSIAPPPTPPGSPSDPRLRNAIWVGALVVLSILAVIMLAEVYAGAESARKRLGAG